MTEINQFTARISDDHPKEDLVGATVCILPDTKKSSPQGPRIGFTIPGEKDIRHTFTHFLDPLTPESSKILDMPFQQP